MQSVVMIILLLGTLSFLLKQSFHRPWWWVSWGGVAAVTACLVWPLAANQSRTQIADFLQTPDAMANSAVLLTVEVVLMVAYCIGKGGERKTRKRTKLETLLQLLLNGFPGMVFFLSIFALLTSLMFSLTGMSFKLISWTMGGVVAVGVPLFTWLVLRLMPDETLRLEMLFTVNLIIGALGVVATVNGRTAVEGTAAIEWASLLGVLALCILGTAVGLIWHWRSSKKTHK